MSLIIFKEVLSSPSYRVLQRQWHVHTFNKIFAFITCETRAEKKVTGRQHFCLLPEQYCLGTIYNV